jgi:uncharacterized protein with HEPN domain
MLLADRELFIHIIDEIDVINELLRQKSYEEIVNDKFLVRTLIRCLEIIGEASRKISPELRSKYPAIPWREIASTRNKIIHDYSGIDYDIVKNIVVNDIPELEFQIRDIIKQ